MSQSSPQLQVKQVSLQTRVGLQHLLSDLSFAVERGDRLAITGASGAGKSSLLRLLNRLSEPSTGEILFEGMPLHRIPVLSLRRQIIFVPQESKLLGMTVGEAIAYPLRLRSLPDSEIQHRLQDWLTRFPIPTDWLNRTESQLSVGQRQWVAIARALVAQPKILLLDEPTSALDVGRSTQLIDILTDLTQHTDTTVLMVNHDLDLARQFGTRLIHLHQGKIVRDQPADQVDWPHLRDTITHLNLAEAQEWDE
ncbi:MAG: ATP-binding cassette domain-containing protein [Synechococcales bacterium]|nr:ATP-binding cassette domain-containing protein [Synechococcales bacterium]